MEQIYEASNTLEAHMVVDLLRQQGITGRVDGEYLQGAVGALPVSGLVRVVVDRADSAAARRVIAHWQQTQASDRSLLPPSPLTGGWYFAAGLMLGVGACLALVRPSTPAEPVVDAAACRPA